MCQHNVTNCWKSRLVRGAASGRLSFEALESRLPLATADIDFVGGLLEIDGSGNADTITVAYEDPADAHGDVVATVRNTNGVVLVQETHDRDDIDALTVNAWGGNDRVTNGTDIPDTMTGGEGADALRGGSGDSTLSGGNGDDTLVGGLGMDHLSGEAGRDQLFADGAALVNGQLTPKSLEKSACGSLADVLAALVDADVLDGGPDADVLYGGGGLDVLLGGDGNDTLSGAECIDLLFGQAGDDVLRGGAGDDYLNGGRGLDKLFGDAGNDVLYGGDQNLRDELWGGAGSDQFVFGGQLGEEWWSQEARDLDDDDDAWVYPWLLSDEELAMYIQPALQ